MGVLIRHRVAILGVVMCCFTLSSANAQSAAQKTYPGTARGLEQLMKELFELAKRGDLQELESRAGQLMLPDPDAWFETMFGTISGRDFALHYSSLRGDLPKRIALSLHDFAQRKLNDIEANRFESGCRPLPTDEQYRLLQFRLTNEPLYDVRFLDSSLRGQALWFFAYEDGAFRYIGRPPMPEIPPVNVPLKTAQRIRVGGDVQQAQLIRPISPEYPPDARAKKLQGTVRLHALISTEGDMARLVVISGQCYLAEAALRAVRKWRYRPTLLNGQPVEVVTTIDVVFQLR
jgi:TonB family C-terminal domain